MCGFIALLEASGVHSFCPEVRVDRSSGFLPRNGQLVAGRIECATYLRNQLLRDLSPVLSAFQRFPNKRLLAEAQGIALPDALITRSKTGFGIPVQRWLVSMGKGGGSISRHAWTQEVGHVYLGRGV